VNLPEFKNFCLYVQHFLASWGQCSPCLTTSNGYKCWMWGC